MKRTAFKKYYVAVILAAAAVRADDGGGAAAFALMAADGRAAALGGAAVALDGLSSCYFNAAAFATLTGDNLTSTYRALALDRKIIQVGYGRPLLAGSGVGACWTNATVTDLEKRSASGNPTGQIRNSQNLFLFGFARDVGAPWFAAGAAGRFYYSLLDQSEGVGFGLDVGVRAAPTQWLALGIAGRDLATKIRWSNDQEEDVPTRFLGGAALRPWPKLILAGQADAGQDEEWRFRAGAEFWADDRLALRAGWADDRPTLGAAVVLPRGGFDVTFDYAFVEEEFAGAAAHTASLTLVF